MAQYITRTFTHKVATLGAPGVKPMEINGDCDMTSTVYLFAAINKIQQKDVQITVSERVETRRMTVEKFLENSEPVPEKTGRGKNKGVK